LALYGASPDQFCTYCMDQYKGVEYHADLRFSRLKNINL
jgi:hypothetical protein